MSDTDGNGIIDGDEKREQRYTQVIDNDIITEISIEGNFSKDINETTSIKNIIDEDMLCANVVGLVGEPFEIETTSTFDTSTITFTIDSTKLDGKTLDDLLLLWYDEKNDNFVELNTQINTENNTISVNTTHFSKYMIVDKQEWFDTWRNAPNYLENCSEYVPYNTEICIDCSGSMVNNDPEFIYNQVFPSLWTTYENTERTTYRKMAIERYIYAMQSEDKTGLIHFEDTQPISDKYICSLTNDKVTLLKNLDPFNGGGTDAKYAVNLAINELNNQTDNHTKIIILLSDGDVNIDTSENDADGIKKKCCNNIKIYTIGLGDGANSTVLDALATKTNGEFYEVATADELSKIYNNIHIEQYQSINWEDNDQDGIPDEFETQGMICSNGQLIFTDPTNPDCDCDGLLDGEEIEVTYGQKYIPGAGNGGHSISAVYFTYKSNPHSVDSDEDGILDSNDGNPLVSSNYKNDFDIISDFNYTPDDVYLLNEKLDSLSSYNNAQGKYDDTELSTIKNKAIAVLTGSQIALIFPDAYSFLKHYLENTGQDYELNVKHFLDTSIIGSNILKNNINYLVDYAKSILKDGESLIFMSNKHIIAHEYSLAEVNWNASLGQCSGKLIAEISRENEKYYIKIRYIVYDFYDWKEGSTSAFIPGLTDGDMFKLHNAGLAQQFYVFGEFNNGVKYELP